MRPYCRYAQCARQRPRLPRRARATPMRTAHVTPAARHVMSARFVRCVQRPQVVVKVWCGGVVVACGRQAPPVQQCQHNAAGTRYGTGQRGSNAAAKCVCKPGRAVGGSVAKARRQPQRRAASARPRNGNSATGAVARRRGGAASREAAGAGGCKGCTPPAARISSRTKVGVCKK